MSEFDPSIVSNNVLERAFDEGVQVSPMKLQKILYFAASEYAKQTQGKQLLSEDFEAWRYGPVLRSVYTEFRAFGGDPIRSYSRDAKGRSYLLDEPAIPGLSSVLDLVWSRTKNRSAVELSRITHMPGSAWHQAYTANGGGTIDQKTIERDSTYRTHLGLE